MLYLLIFSHNFWMLHCIFILLSLCVSVFEVLITLNLSSLILAWTVMNILMSPSKPFFISATVFLEFLLIHPESFRLSTYIICMLLMLSTFSIKTHNILIIVILSFLCGNSNICVTSEYGSDASFVSSDYIFSFVLLCNPLLPPKNPHTHKKQQPWTYYIS